MPESLKTVYPAPQTELNFRLSPYAKQRQSSCSGSPPVYQDLSTRHGDWPVKITNVNLPIRMKGNSKRISGYPLIHSVQEQGYRRYLEGITKRC